MNLGTQKGEKARANFAGVRDDAGRCGVACMRACPWAPCHAQRLPLWGKITSFSKKPSFFGKSLKICGQGSSQGQGTRPRPRHAAKAKARCQGTLRRPPQGMLPRPRHAAKAPMARSQGQGSPRTHHAARSPPRHAAKAMARSQGHGMQPPKARCTQPRPCSSEGQGSSPPWRPWHAAPKARSQGQGMQPRPWHAAPQGTLHAAKAMQQRRPRHAPAKALARTSEGLGTQPRPRHAPHGMQPRPSQGQGMQPAPQGDGT
jgi:hypothetical protein